MFFSGHLFLAGTGKSDLITLDTSQGDIGNAIFLRNFRIGGATPLRQVRTLWRVDATGDLDGDGFGDIVWRFTGNSGNIDDTGVSYIWFTDGNGVTQVRKRGGAPLNWNLLGAADINNDGAADMVYVSPEGAIRVLMATANRTCANISGGSLTQGFSALRLADFTGNRTGDILARDPASGKVKLISLDAVGATLPTYVGPPDDANASCTKSDIVATQHVYNLPSTNPSWSYYASGDYNGDGIFDIVWQQPDGTLTTWLMSPRGGAPTVIANSGSAPLDYTVLKEGGGGAVGLGNTLDSKVAISMQDAFATFVNAFQNRTCSTDG